MSADTDAERDKSIHRGSAAGHWESTAGRQPRRLVKRDTGEGGWPAIVRDLKRLVGNPDDLRAQAAAETERRKQNQPDPTDSDSEPGS